MTPMTTRWLVLVVGATLCLTSLARAQVPDHLQCYKIKDTSIILKGTVGLTPVAPFPPSAGCKVSSAKLYCVGSVKSPVNVLNNVTPITPNGYNGAAVTEDRICYKASCPSVVVPDETVTDQFGSHNLTKLKTGMFCTPANIGTTYCGNGTIDGSEDCDGAQLGGATCVTLGYGSGTLACGPGCRFDVSGCIPGAFPASGQTTCWNPSGTPVLCTGLREDGDLQAGASLSYQDNGDGTITDLNTGLMWEKKTDDGSIHDRDTQFTWANAFAQVVNLNTANFAGHNDWRLPNARELLSIIDYGTSGPAIDPTFHSNCFGGCTGSGCACTAFGGHWSSTTVPSLPNAAYNVNFFDGSVTFLSKSSMGAARAVRGGPQ
jgi:hypothetical protein